MPRNARGPTKTIFDEELWSDDVADVSDGSAAIAVLITDDNIGGLATVFRFAADTETGVATAFLLAGAASVGEVAGFRATTFTVALLFSVKFTCAPPVNDLAAMVKEEAVARAV